MNPKQVKFIKRYSQDVRDAMTRFFVATEFQKFTAGKQKIPIEPATLQIDFAHDHYVKAIYVLQLRKLASLGDLVLNALAKEDFLAYALGGRALFELVAVWDYYLRHKYSEYLIPGTELKHEDFLKIIGLHKCFIYGTRFDWNMWLSGDEAGLICAYSNKAREKKRQSQAGEMEQVNVLTCVQKFSNREPKFGVMYDLLCDLVHPNMGSNIFLGTLASKLGVVLDRDAEFQLGKKIIENTFNELERLTFGQISELTILHFAMLVTETSPRITGIGFT
jgi:hypothetical protein